jgi:hypothetical protein
VQKSRPKKHRIPKGVEDVLCKGITEWCCVLQSTWESTGQKKSRHAHVMKYGGGIWGRRCCGGGCVEVEMEVVVGVVLNKSD